MIQTAIAKIVGTPNDSSWVQVHSYLPSEEEKIHSHGQLIAVLALRNVSEGIKAVEAGREVLLKLRAEYFDKEGTILERLKDAVGNLSHEFTSLSPEIVVAVLWKKYIYFCSFGTGKVFLFRQGELFKILETCEDQGALSGQVKEEDTFIFGTDSFFKIVQEKTLLEILGRGLSTQETVDELAPFVHRFATPTLGAAIVEIKGISGEMVRGTDEEVGRGGEPLSVLKAVEEYIPAPAPKTSPVPYFSFLKGKFRDSVVSLAHKLPEQGVYVRQDAGSNRKTAVSVGIVLILLLVISIGFGIKQKGIRDYRSSYEDQLIQAQTLYSDALLQKQVNAASSKDLFVQSEQIINNLISQGIQDDRVNALKNSIDQSRGDVLGVMTANPSTFLDLSLIRSGVSASELVLHRDTMAVLDKVGGRIMSVAASTKEAKVIAGSEKIGSINSIAVYVDRYFSQGDKGVVQIERSGKDIVLIQPDEEVGSVYKVEVFGGNVYVFAQNGEVWRYPAVEAGVASKQRWLGTGVSAESAQGIDVAIDGSIWILGSGGKVVKFTRGVPESVSIKGLDKDFSNPSAIYTNENIESIFILDSGNGRIVEISKTGDYKKQYLLPDVESVKDLVASKESGKIFLLTETKILEVPLK